MSVPAPEVDWESIAPRDISEEEQYETFDSVPDHTASREERRSFLSYLGKKPTESDEKPARGRPRKRKKPVSRAKQGAFVEPLMQMYGFAGMALMAVDEHCGTVVLENAEQCAKTMDELAYQNESVRRVLDTLTTTSAVGQVLMAHAPILLAIGAHHGKGRIPFIPAFVPAEEKSEN